MPKNPPDSPSNEQPTNDKLDSLEQHREHHDGTRLTTNHLGVPEGALVYHRVHRGTQRDTEWGTKIERSGR